MNMNFRWSDESDDDQVLAIMEGIVDKSVAIAEARNLSHRYLYQNYAYIKQDVFSGYGSESKSRLFDIHQRYDPEHLFVKLQPGYFKLELEE